MKPVEEGHRIQLEIIDLTHDGLGIGKVDRFPIFVPHAIPGEIIETEVTEVKKNFALGKIIKIIFSSEERVVPPCPIYYECGGCNTQHISYIKQLYFKTKLVQDNLLRIGGIDIKVEPCLGMEQPWRYRNKSQVPFGIRNGQVVAGFFAPGTHDIIDMDTCIIQSELADEIIQYMKALVKKYRIPTYDETKHQGILRHVIVRYGYITGDYMVNLVVTTAKIPSLTSLITELTIKFPQIKSIVLNINERKINTILGERTIVVYGEPYIYDYIGDVKYAISAKSFFQVNPQQTKKLYDVVSQFSDLKGNEVIIDAYCGIGSIGLYLSKQVKAIYGVEIVADAINDAKLNASINHFDNAFYEVGKAEEVIMKWQKQGIVADLIIVDPPRKGCDGTLLDTIMAMEIPKIVYVSCDPSTLARDLKILSEDYEIIKVQPVDMFPQTMHVECVVLMSRVGK